MAKRIIDRARANAYAREWRKKRGGYAALSAEEKFKDNCRSYAGVYKRRGHWALQKQPCLLCGAEDSQMHHPDYTKPLSVLWLCQPCHLLLHQVLKT